MNRRIGPFLWLTMLAVCTAGCDSSPAPSSPAQAAVPATSQRSAAAPVQFAADFRVASEQALREGKPLLLFFTAAWCEHCGRMTRETFSAQQVADLSQRFVCVQIDADQAAEVCQKFDVREFPTVQFVSARGAALHRLVGRRPPNVLIDEMHTALQAVAYDLPEVPTVIRK
jgi:protein disulfide-isomerase